MQFLSRFVRFWKIILNATTIYEGYHGDENDLRTLSSLPVLRDPSPLFFEKSSKRQQKPMAAALPFWQTTDLLHLWNYRRRLIVNSNADEVLGNCRR